MGGISLGILIGLIAWFVVRCLAAGVYTVNQNERAVKTNFGRAERIPGATTLNDPISQALNDDEKQRYVYPQVRVIMSGGPYFKLPWQKIYKVSIATQTMNMAFDLTGQIRYRISERNLYAYLFGVKNPIAHVMGYFVSVLRERIATFEAPVDPSAGAAAAGSGISINDLRKNLRDLNSA
jgi:regulator of protease activity HflC (stomatin/prohibitin superfamily)